MKNIIVLFVVTVIFAYTHLCFFPTERIVASSVFQDTHGFLHDTNSQSTKGEIIEHGSRNKKAVALTFDADMTDGMRAALLNREIVTYADRRIIDLLIQNNIKATVFLTGMWMETYPEETKLLAENPLFELANHSYSHPSFAGDCYGLKQIPSSEFAFEIEKTQQILKELTGTDNKYFRFPGGCYDQTSLDLVTKEGMVTVHWDTVAHDGFSDDTEQIITNVLKHTQNGSIIVMHIGGEQNTPKTFEALQVITFELKKKGFAFVTISELLNLSENIQLLSYLR